MSAPESTPVPPMPVVTSAHFNGATCNAVNARDLHRFLENKDGFAHWITDRISQYGFVEHRDFEVLGQIPQNPQGGRPTKEYALTVGMAKELAMVERNERGKQARAYFIECEKRALAPAQNPFLTMDQEQLLEFSLQQVKEKKALACRVQEQVGMIAAKDRAIAALAPLAEFASDVMATGNIYTLEECADLAGAGLNRLPAWMRAKGMLMETPFYGGFLLAESTTLAGNLSNRPRFD